jgi:ribosomal-protein-alanine N-acetyltransferase
MQIDTQRLIIRNFAAADAPALNRTLGDPRIFTHLPEEVPELADVERLIAWFQDRDARNRNRNRDRELEDPFLGTNFALILKSTQRIIGWCGLQPFEPYPDKMEIFYGLSPAHWSQGYGTEAARAVLRYGFETLRLDQVVAGVKPENSASIRILEKIGLVRLGSVDQVPQGAEWYLGEWYYAIDRARYESAPVPRTGRCSSG